MSRNEHNNGGKELSRPQIVKVINEHVPGPKAMFEFLGGGIGAEHYAEHLEDLRFMNLCEMDEGKIADYKDSGRYDALDVPVKHITTDALNTFNVMGEEDFQLNVLNLDFCTFFYDNGTDYCTAGLIRKAFENDVVEDGGLLLLTFQVRGIGVNMHKTALKNQPEICAEIENIATKAGYQVEEVFSFLYRSGRPTKMLNLGFKVNKIGV